MDDMDWLDHYEAVMADFQGPVMPLIPVPSEDDYPDDDDWVPPPKEWVNRLYRFFRYPPPVYEVMPRKKIVKPEPSTSTATDSTTSSTTATSTVVPTTSSNPAPTSAPAPSSTNPAPLPKKAKKRKVKVDENGQVIKRPRKKVPKKAVKPLSPVKEESASSWEVSRPSSTSPVPSIGSGPDENLPPVPLRLVAPQKPVLPLKLSPDGGVRLPRLA